MSTVPVDRLLLGPQEGRSALEYAARTRDLMWSSTTVAAGPHVALLRSAGDVGELSDAEILDGPYGTHARRCLDVAGNYFWAVDDAGIIDVARSFIARYQGAATQPARRGQSASGPVRVQPIRDSDCYQVIDGHHRLAISIARGADSARVKSYRFSTVTPLQDTLRRMSWLDGVKQLYQPVAAPELAGAWTTIRKCVDRRDKMQSLLSEQGLLQPDGRSYLDIASCYGWFVAEMGKLGFAAEGVELDPLARDLGIAVYGLKPGQIATDDCVNFLDRANKRWDVVSCFSLLHHFAMGRGRITAGELLGRIDAVTSQVLFLDTGQAHEEWFRHLLPDWNTNYVEKFLSDNSTFDRIIDLGPDEDAVAPFETNYGRHLFACVRG